MATAKPSRCQTRVPAGVFCHAGHRPMLTSSLDGSERREADIGALDSIAWLLLRVRLTLQNVKAQPSSPCSRLNFGRIQGGRSTCCRRDTGGLPRLSVIRTRAHRSAAKAICRRSSKRGSDPDHHQRVRCEALIEYAGWLRKMSMLNLRLKDNSKR